MGSLYDQFIDGFKKCASTDPDSSMSSDLKDFSTDDLMKLASELDTLAATPDLEALKKIAPVYAAVDPEAAAEAASDAHIDTAQKIDNIDNNSAVVDEITQEQADPEQMVTLASEKLMQVLKEGAELEDTMEKDAFDIQYAAEVANKLGEALAPTKALAFDYSSRIMDKIKTVSAKTGVNIAQAAEQVGAAIINATKATGETIRENPITSTVGAGVAGFTAGAVSQYAKDRYTHGFPASPNKNLVDMAIDANLQRKEASEYFLFYKEAFGEEALQKLAYEAYDELEKEAAVDELYKLAEDSKKGMNPFLAGILGAGAVAGAAAVGKGKYMAKAEKKIYSAPLEEGADAAYVEGMKPIVMKSVGDKYNKAAVGAAAGAGVVAGGGTAVMNNNKTATVIDYLDYLDKTASDLEQTYEKLAEEVGVIAEQVLLAAGQAQGLQDPQLHEFVQKSLEEVKTLAAKKDVNLAQAAKLYLAGDTGSVTGVVEPIAPPPSAVPTNTINSNVTSSPDEAIPQMVAPVDANVAAGMVAPANPVGAEAKVAAINEFVKGLLKEAMIANMQA